MSLSQRARRAWGIVRSQGARWVAERLVLEAQKRSGYEARIYRPQSWGEASVGALAPESASLSDAALLEAWRDGAGAAWGRARGGPAWQRALMCTLDETRVERRDEDRATVNTEQASRSVSLPTSTSPRTSRARLVARAEAILAGRFTLFSRHEVEAGFPPDWLANPLRGPASHPPADRHWSRLGMEGEPYGDLKFVWELSRAPWAFLLARAYAATHDERFAEGFWRLWLDWIDENPPHRSVQWKCGQECALRLIAISFAVQVVAPAAATTPARFKRHLEAMAAHGARIAQGGWYARLQNNNHSMSEAAGLYTAGVFYPMLAGAAAWRAEGWRHLEEEALRLLRPDGTFTQKSHNYHRLMLHDYLWASSVSELAQERWSRDVHERLSAAVAYLEGVVDPLSGGAPNFGSNDGALILPLDEADYGDFGPVLRAATFWRDGVRREAASKPETAPAIDEALLWLFGPRALEASVKPAPTPSALALAHGGIYTLRQRESWIFTHAEDFRDRPGQADLLHVDVWWRGLAIARDAGTFLYYGDAKAFAWFKGTRCHNTVTVDERDQMEAGPRFLWSSRAHAHARVVPATTTDGRGAALVLQHDGYHRLPSPITHVRAVRARGEDAWLVADELVPLTKPGETASTTTTHAFTLHWLLADLPHTFDIAPTSVTGEPARARVVLETPHGPFYVEVIALDGARPTFTLVRAQEGTTPWGWQSLHYGDRTPALSLRAQVNGPRARFLTVLAPRPLPTPLPSAWLDDNHLRL